ncbi:hypothetical protein BC832DRAFT_536628 [Gaertneriomyces semiglobifer]|nr:hypothetical protein BC832DRAFT_536628 [Gaertneriomyces semiglobifer]
MQIFVKWSMTWKKQNPGYEYRLWTDDDNRRMIAQHYPWALAAYDGMPKNIQRADMARYFYMHRYGCVYAYEAWKRGEVEGPEWMTGPIVLRETYLRYMTDYPPGSEADEVVLLEPNVIYPVDWSRFGEIGWACSPKSNTFDENRCHELIDLQHSYAVTYWSHTWG